MSEWQHPDPEIHGRLERWNAASFAPSADDAGASPATEVACSSARETASALVEALAHGRPRPCDDVGTPPSASRTSSALRERSPRVARAREPASVSAWPGREVGSPISARSPTSALSPAGAAAESGASEHRHPAGDYAALHGTDWPDRAERAPWRGAAMPDVEQSEPEDEHHLAGPGRERSLSQWQRPTRAPPPRGRASGRQCEPPGAGRAGVLRRPGGPCLDRGSRHIIGVVVAEGVVVILISPILISCGSSERAPRAVTTAVLVARRCWPQGPPRRGGAGTDRTQRWWF